MPLTLEIVTPEAKVYSDAIDSVVIPTEDGEIGILPGHIPLLTKVDSGELQVTKGGQTILIVVGRGFAEIEGDKVAVLAESAITAEKIDEGAVELAMQRAEEQLRSKETLDTGEVDRLEGFVRFAVAQLNAKRRRR